MDGFFGYVGHVSNANKGPHKAGSPPVVFAVLGCFSPSSTSRLGATKRKENKSLGCLR